jgi:hypothetical protein
VRRRAAAREKVVPHKRVEEEVGEESVASRDGQSWVQTRSEVTFELEGQRRRPGMAEKDMGKALTKVLQEFQSAAPGVTASTWR